MLYDFNCSVFFASWVNSYWIGIQSLMGSCECELQKATLRINVRIKLKITIMDASHSLL
jgi:hypothetical protein